MMNLTTDAVKQLKKSIMKSFGMSGKIHLVITGSKKCGKTTVLNEILKDEESYGGIITFALRDDKVPPVCVVLRDINDPSVCGKVAVRNNSCTGLIPQSCMFDNLGREILRRYADSCTKLIIIDEIGFLESSSEGYQDEIMRCFDKNKVIAVVKKELNPFTEKIVERDDVFIADIEDFLNNIKAAD
jgi:nucleoside-triphosphatase THEP1